MTPTRMTPEVARKLSIAEQHEWFRRWRAQVLVPPFDRYKVDLVLNGHHHIYERTEPIRAGVPTTSAPTGATVRPATEGTTYAACGGAGKSLYSFSAPDSFEGNIDNVASVSGYVNQPGTAGPVERPEMVTWSQVR